MDTELRENRVDAVGLPAVNSRQNLHLRSQEVQEIISKQPGFLSKWALLIFLLIIILVICGTWFIKYPDIIQANATLTAANAPKEIVTRQDGKLVKLFVKNDDTVAVAQTIGWIESTADHTQVTELDSLLGEGVKVLAANQTQQASKLFARQFYRLGELQAGYQQFNTALQQFNDYLINGYYYRRKAVLQQDLDFLKNMHANTQQQKDLMLQDLQLSEESYKANASLFKDKVISPADLRTEKSKLVNKQITLPQLDATMLTNENQQADKQRDIDELEHSISQQKIIFQQALQTLKSQADDWIKKYVLKAPVAGKVVFIIPLQENQYLSSGKMLGYVNPFNSYYYAQVNLPQINFGKLMAGQSVQLRFDAYPYQEFGFVPGKLQYISKVPSDSGFLATIQLPAGLVTNYHKNIQYNSGLKSQALIITKNMRLLQRFYYTIVKATQR